MSPIAAEPTTIRNGGHISLIGWPFHVHMPTFISLGVILLVLVGAIVISLQAEKRDRQRGIPTLILFKNGTVEAQKVGAVSKSQLAAFLDSHL